MSKGKGRESWSTGGASESQQMTIGAVGMHTILVADDVP